jgi:hypothetical protein
MKTTFQAKELQEMLSIPKHRYEYIARHFGIIPEVEQGEGSGRMNIYSFKDALIFAIAHHASEIGLIPAHVKKLVALLGNPELLGGGYRAIEDMLSDFFSPDGTFEFTMGIVFRDGEPRFFVHKIQHGGGPLQDALFYFLFPFWPLTKAGRLAGRVVFEIIKADVKDLARRRTKKVAKRHLPEAYRELGDSYSLLNLPRIKAKVLAYAKRDET